MKLLFDFLFDLPIIGIRSVTVMFVNLPEIQPEKKSCADDIQKAMEIVLDALSEFHGKLNGT